MANLKILVTGANGQVGQELQVLAKNSNYQFLFLDRTGLDISNKKQIEAVFSRFQPDFCLNCAAYTAVDKAEDEPQKAELINALAVQYLAEACQKNNVRLLHISSDYVYDNDINRPLRETDPTTPKSVYAATKLRGDELALQTLPATVILRTSWVYSFFGHNFLKTMLRLGTARDQLTIVYDQIGAPTYARDIALTMLQIVAAIQNGADKVGGVYNFAPSGVTSWYDYALALFQMENIDCEVRPIPSSGYPTPASRPSFSVLNCEKIQRVFHLKIPYWQDSVRHCLERLR